MLALGHSGDGAMTVDEYLALVPSQHADKPRFMGLLRAYLEPLVRLQNLAREMGAAYDVDSATGAQLDVIARWVGVTRSAPLFLDGFAFTFDDTDKTGWDNGFWQGYIAGGGNLPDDLFRTLIKAKIKANHWDGSIPEAYEIFDAALSVHDAVMLVDNDAIGSMPRYFTWDGTAAQGWDAGIWQGSVTDIMTLLVLVRDGVLPAVEQALVLSGFLPIKPAGVTVIYQTIGA